jgi:hypothetical protein
MSSKDDKDEERVKLPIFEGDKEKYRDFMLLFEVWEDKEDVRAATTIDMVDELPSEDEYLDGERTRETIAPDGTIREVVTNLTRAEKKLYKDNAKSRSKLLMHVSTDIRELMTTAGGEKNSVFLMKRWFEDNFAEVTASDSLQDLNRKLNELHPGDYDHAMFYLGKLDALNVRLGKVEPQGKYKLDELQLKTVVLSKLPDGGNNGPDKWGSFQADYVQRASNCNSVMIVLTSAKGLREKENDDTRLLPIKLVDTTL